MARERASGRGEARRRLPSVDALLREPAGVKAAAEHGRPLLKACIRRALADARARAAAGAAPPADNELLKRAAAAAARISSGLSPVINATGVVLHTGLGRAPLPEGAAEAAARAAGAYTDLEVDLSDGRRGRRTSRVEDLLEAITGAEGALVVNNNAAALLLALSALARRKEVLVSRGELIEIGGEFRLPEIMAASGAKLLEVGTTNRTRLSDYRSALGDRTGLILKVHPSNFRVVGFSQSPSAKDLAALAAKAEIPLLYDLGSGLLDRQAGIPADEPTVADALAQGADLVCFSGDKLLGGPQAGIVLGRADLVERLRRNPIARAVRVDKMQVAALGWVLDRYARARHAEIPVWRMLGEPASKVRRRAQELLRSVGVAGGGATAAVRKTEAAAGGGSLPGFAIASYGVHMKVDRPERLAEKLRNGDPPVFCRVEADGVLLDVRTVADLEIERLARAIARALP